ncbi:MAG: RnfABCDGE type electron transport complex subunit G [Paludibacteraceae bacterium]|nr:RnfABCDGE type electron transport complex subunit G [Paludibacteraceae bacterium]
MKKIASTLPNMLLSLTIIALIAAGLLAWVKTITDEPIRLAEEKKQTEALSQVLPAFDKIETEDDKDGVVYKAYQNNHWVGTAVECTGNGFSGDIVVMVGFDNKHQLIDYVVLKQTETPGLGTKMVTWFKEKANIKGRKMDLNNPLKVSKEASKDGGDVQAITAATISSRAFIEVVNNAYRIAMGHDATTGATDVE